MNDAPKDPERQYPLRSRRRKAGARSRGQHRLRYHEALARYPARPVLTWTLIALNVGVMAVMAIRGVPVLNPSVDDLMVWGANFGPWTTGGEWWRLLTYAFLHIGLVHIAANMVYLWLVGRTMERLLGHGGFLLLYLLSALGGGLLSIAWQPEIASAGASGAVFGLFGGLIGCYSRNRSDFPPALFRAQIVFAVFFVVYQVGVGLLTPVVDNAGHLGGLFTGLIAGWILARPLQPDRHASPARFAWLGTVAALLIGLGFVAVWRVGDDPRAPVLAVSIRAEAASDAADWELAIDEYTRWLEIDPDNTEALLGRGWSRYMLDRNDAALEDFERVLALDPSNGMALNNRGLIRFEQGDADTALPDFEKAILLIPGSAYPWCNRGRIYCERNQHERAINDCTRALEADPSYAYALEMRAMCWFHLAQYDVAVNDLTRALEIDPKKVNYRYQRAQMHYILGNWQRSLMDFASVLAQDPDHLEVRIYSWLCRAQMGEAEQASRELATFFMAARQRYPESSYVRVFDFLNGKITREQLFDISDIAEEERDTAKFLFRFFSATRHLLDDEEGEALTEFERVEAFDYYQWHEHHSALAEMRRIRGR